jgi:hypothetical protein
MTIYDQTIKFKPPPEIDPVEEAAAYVNHKWFQQLAPIKTECYRCHAESPIVNVHQGVLAFGNPLVRGLNHRNRNKNNIENDITKEVIEAFAKVGWKFQLRRSYCPKCKGLGTVS